MGGNSIALWAVILSHAFLFVAMDVTVRASVRGVRMGVPPSPSVCEREKTQQPPYIGLAKNLKKGVLWIATGTAEEQPAARPK